jgi:hypothetical protein
MPHKQFRALEVATLRLTGNFAGIFGVAATAGSPTFGNWSFSEEMPLSFKQIQADSYLF